MAAEDGDLSDFDIHRIMEALSTRQSKSVASCALSIKILLTEIQQQLLELMEGNAPEVPVSHSSEETVDEMDEEYYEDEVPLEMDTAIKDDEEDYKDMSVVQETVVTGATVPITGSRIKSPNPYPCPECKMMFSTKKALSRHVARHTDDAFGIENSYIINSTKAVESIEAVGVMNIEDGKLAEVKLEPKNGADSNRQPIKIKLSIPKSGTRLTCAICGIETLKQHMPRHMRKHTGVKPFSCMICGVSFARKDKLKEHMKKHELGMDITSPAKIRKVKEPKTTQCKKCDFSTEDKLMMKEHRKSHPTKVVYRCEECNKEFHCASHFEQHNIKHRNEKPYMCDMCGVSFSREPNLARHIRSHTTPAPYTCKFCNKPYHRNNELIVHERTHTGEKPYICEVCGNGYASTKYLKRHLFTHTGLKPFKCDLCDRAFARPENMKAHRKLHEKSSNRLSANHDTVANAFHAANQLDARADETMENMSSPNETDMYQFPSTSNARSMNNKSQLNVRDNGATENIKYPFSASTIISPTATTDSQTLGDNNRADRSLMDNFKIPDSDL